MATPNPRENSGQQGSTLLAALFVLALVAVTGAALCVFAMTRVHVGGSELSTEAAYYLAEAGVEHARIELYSTDDDLDFDDALLALSTDGNLDFDPRRVQVDWSADGVPTITGHGDDQPLAPLAPLGQGWYAAFLNNDPGETINTTDDANHRVMVTGVGIGPDRRVEIVRAIVERWELLPSSPEPASDRPR